MKTFNPELYRGNIIISRIRLARNVAGLPFRIRDGAVADKVIKEAYYALKKTEPFDLFKMKGLSEVKKEALKERHLISRNLIENEEFGAAIINRDESVSVMINEEDVIREQCFMRGFRLDEAYKKINFLDDALSKRLEFAFDDELGYLTACPTNLGTGMRASVMMFLPALTESGKIEALYREVSERGLTIRGVYGEGSKAEGYNYQISNEITLGAKEEEIVKEVGDTVERICLLERDETERLYGDNEIKTIDRVKRAYGILTNAFLLTYKEFLSLAGDVKLGAMLGYINIADVEKLDELTLSVRPANLIEQYGENMTETECDIYRAEVVAKILARIKE